MSLQDVVQKPALTEIAGRFFDACETGKGWAGCAAFCTLNASFSAQAEPLDDIKTLKDYTEWNRNILVPFPDVSFEVMAFAADEARRKVIAYAVMEGIHTGDGGPVPPTGKKAAVDYVYVMEFEGDKICHMTKIWNSQWSFKAVGWL
jgi:predicted ester cyclase